MQIWPPDVQLAAVVWQLPTTQTMLMQMLVLLYSVAHWPSVVQPSQNSEPVLQIWLVALQLPAVRQLPEMHAPEALHRWSAP